MTKKLTNKKSKRIIRGGDIGENISNTLLINSIISYLPTTETVKSESKIRDYLSSIDALTLLEIIGSDEKYLNSKSLNYLIDCIDKNTLDIIKEMGDAIKIPSIRKNIDMFEVDCMRLSKKTSIKELLELPNYLLDCNTSLCNRNLNWYDIILGFRKLDEDYEELVKKEIFNKKIIINTNKTLNARNKLRNNELVRDIMKKRILKCCQDPRSFFDKMKGTVAWIDYNHCTSCQTEDCILYIDDNYKNFLMMDLGISSVKKIKILIFMEIRIHLLSKFIFIESLRLSSERKRKIKILVEKIYRNDAKNGRIVTNIQGSHNKMYGGNIGPLENSQNPTADNINPGLAYPEGVPSAPGQEASPGAGQETYPGAGQETSPGAGQETSPGAGEETSPGAGQETSPSDSSSNSEYNKMDTNITSDNVKDEEQEEQEEQEDEDEEELVVYLTYNILKEVTDINTIKNKIMHKLQSVTMIADKNNIMIGDPSGNDQGFRKGLCTYSFEVTINKSEDKTETFDNIKENISDSVKDGTFENIMNIDQNTLSLRDVYFTGLNGYFDDNMLRYKRVLAEIKLPYPQGGYENKMRFSRKIKSIIYNYVNSLFSKFNLSKRRIQLELISAIDGDDSSILVQFMIMDSYSKLESSYSIAREISENITNINNNIIHEINMLDKCYIFDIDHRCDASKKKLIDLGVKKVGMQKDNISIINNNCGEVIKNLRDNYVSNNYLSENCSDAIDKELGNTN